MFCKNCGAQIDDGADFCSECGSPVGGKAPSDGGYGQSSSSENRIFGIVSYITWIGFIIAIVASDKNDAFSRHHINQGLVLNLLTTIVNILSWILGLIPFIGIIFKIIFWIVDVIIFIIWLIALISACKGEIKDMPILGSIKILK